MKYKIKNLCDKFVTLLSIWDGVECIQVNESAEGDTLDPYFALILDVFYNEDIPTPGDRARMYGPEAIALECTPNKDRFIVGDVPVHLEFKFTDKVNASVNIASKQLSSFYLIKNSGTYGFYRLANSEVLFNRNGWIFEVKEKLLHLSDDFWDMMRYASQSKMEHFLSDLGAAVQERDDFNYLLSSSGFIKTACMTLFCVNKQFEPSHRAYFDRVRKLSTLSPSFSAHLETFLRTAEGLSNEHRYGVAKVLAKEIVAL
jgi:hypothetical protein